MSHSLAKELRCPGNNSQRFSLKNALVTTPCLSFSSCLGTGAGRRGQGLEGMAAMWPSGHRSPPAKMRACGRGWRCEHRPFDCRWLAGTGDPGPTQVTVWFFTQNHGRGRGLDNVLSRPKPLSRAGVACHSGSQASRGASAGPDSITEDRRACVCSGRGGQSLGPSGHLHPSVFS